MGNMILTTLLLLLLAPGEAGEVFNYRVALCDLYFKDFLVRFRFIDGI